MGGTDASTVMFASKVDRIRISIHILDKQQEASSDDNRKKNVIKKVFSRVCFILLSTQEQAENL